MKRMDRAEFMAKLAPLDEERMRKALWNLYWRGSAAMRERIEAEIEPDLGGHRQHRAKEPVDADGVLDEVGDFVAVAEWPAVIPQVNQSLGNGPIRGPEEGRGPAVRPMRHSRYPRYRWTTRKSASVPKSSAATGTLSLAACTVSWPNPGGSRSGK